MNKAKASNKKKPIYEDNGDRRRTIRWTNEELEALMEGVKKCVISTVAALSSRFEHLSSRNVSMPLSEHILGRHCHCSIS